MWMGKCSNCGAWDSLVTSGRVEKHASGNGGATFAVNATELGGVAEAVRLLEIEAPTVGRFSTGIGELDRVLGGGLVVGSVVLIGGEPGIGKSTLMMQAAIAGARDGHRVLYATSEESAFQCRLRAQRLLTVDSEEDAGLDGLYVLSDTDLAHISEQAVALRPRVLIVDSIQMIHRKDLDAAPGSVSQIRRCCLELVYLARQLQMAVLIVGHVTKDGQLAGPRLLEHLVDVVLSFEGDRHHALRGLHAVKNRFGTTLEIGLFEMEQHGLTEVKDAAAFLDPDAPARSGAVVSSAIHGSRCLLVEVQALVATGVFGQARRRATGIDGSRLTMLSAVLEQHAQLKLVDQDIYASTVGGLKVTEPAVDLALCLSIIGGYSKMVLPKQMCAIGEVGLGGEVRSVPQLEQRVAQARRRGYQKLLIPITQESVTGDDLIGVASVADLGQFFEKKSSNEPYIKQLSDV